MKAAPSVDYDPEYSSSKMYLNEMRSYEHELKTHNIDLLQDRTAGHSLISHIVFNKLPVNLRRELIHRTSYNYPSLDEVFCHYNEAINLLSVTPGVRGRFRTVTTSGRLGRFSSITFFSFFFLAVTTLMIVFMLLFVFFFVLIMFLLLTVRIK